MTTHALVCFGGAAGQLACQVADALGIETILIHQHASVLSAYGMGLADIGAHREQALEVSLSEKAVSKAKDALATLQNQTTQEVKRQGVATDRITHHRHAFLKYAGTDNPVDVAFGPFADMTKSFEEKHRAEFGFVDPTKALILEAVAIESVGNTDNDPIKETVASRREQGGAPTTHETGTLFADGNWSDVPIFQRQELEAGVTIEGPSIISDPLSSITLEPEWAAKIYDKNVVLNRTKPQSHLPIAGTTVNPIMLEVFNSLFMSIAEQMGYALEKTAHSVNIKERLDFSCAIFDSTGNLVANAPHMPVHLGSMGESVKSVIRAVGTELKAGDTYVLNNPYNGGTHLPDITVVTPVFDDQGTNVTFYVAARGHHADIGGISPGSMPAHSKSIQDEGVLIDNFLLVENGRFREVELIELLSSGPYPARNPQQNVADLKAQVAACQKGIDELKNLVAVYGLDVVQSYMAHVQDNAEESVRRVLDRLQSGQFEITTDNGDLIRVSIEVDSKNREATIDFTGTSSQTDTNFNAPSAVTRAAILYVFRCLVGEDIPLNDGCLKPLKIIIPERSLLDPEFPAAVVAGNVETSQAVTDALFAACGVMAAAQGTMNNLTFGNDRHQYYETICGGSGAGDGFNGTSAVHTHMTNSRLTDPEVLEFRFPVRLESFEIREDTGGKGEFIGGNGTRRELRFLESMDVSLLASRRTTKPFGLSGGTSAVGGVDRIVLHDGTTRSMKGCDQVSLSENDRIIIETPGGGGFGDAKNR